MQRGFRLRLQDRRQRPVGHPV